MSTQAPASARLGRRIAWGWVVLSSIAIAAFAVTPYLTASLSALAADGAGLAPGYADRPLPVIVAFYTHVVAGGLALVLAPFQFWAGLRARAPRVHRMIGRISLSAIAVAGIASLVLAPFNTAGLVGFFGFGTLGVLWLYTGWRGYRAIRRGDVATHQAWMIRNFSLTYAAVTLRLWIGILIAVQLPFVVDGEGVGAAFENAYAVVPFLCWLPNIVIAEILIARRGLPGLRWTRPAASVPAVSSAPVRAPQPVGPSA